MTPGLEMSETFDPYHKWLGIRPDERPCNWYRLLGVVTFEEDREVISNAADQRAALLKTFQTGKHGPLSQQLLNEVARATVCLLNSQRKAEYDRELRAALAQLGPPATPSRAGAPELEFAPRHSTPTPVAGGLPTETLFEPLRPQRRTTVRTGRRSTSAGKGIWLYVAGLLVLLSVLVFAAGRQSQRVAVTPAIQGNRTLPDNAPANPPLSGEKSLPADGAPPPLDSIRPGARSTPSSKRPLPLDHAVIPGPDMLEAAPLSSVPKTTELPTELQQVGSFTVRDRAPLPARSDSAKSTLATISSGQVALEVVNPEGSVPPFEMLEVSGTWLITHAGQSVAQIERSGDEFTIAWATRTPRSADYLRNALIRFRAGDKSAATSLRDQYTLARPTIDLEKPVMTVSLDAQLWGLDEDKLSLELVDLQNAPLIQRCEPPDRRVEFGKKLRAYLNNEPPFGVLEFSLVRYKDSLVVKIVPLIVNSAGKDRRWTKKQVNGMYKLSSQQVATAKSGMSKADGMRRELVQGIEARKKRINDFNRGPLSGEIENLQHDLSLLDQQVAQWNNDLPALQTELSCIESIGNLGNRVHQKSRLGFRVIYKADGELVEVAKTDE